VAALLAGAFLSCGKDSPSIKIGGLMPLTGEVSPFGATSRKGYDLAVKEWNERGGVLGRPLELLVHDDQAIPGQGLDGLTRLIEHDRIVALLGANISKVSLAAAPIAQAAGIPMISPLSSHPQVTAAGDCIYRICFTDRDQGAAGAVFAFHDLKARKAACIFDGSDSFPAEIAQIFKGRFTSLGGKVVAFVDHPSGITDFRPHIARILGARPDLIYLPDYYRDAVLIAKEARAQGFKGALVGGDGWDSPRILPPEGLGLDSGFFTTNFSKDEDRPIVKDFVKKYRALHHADPDAFAALAYDAGNVLFDAIRRAGTTSSQAVKTALLDTDYPGVSGQIRFDAQRNPVKSPVIIEIKGGRMLYRGKIAP
jgi:branched-chain amino acid transport system substrate-binding protein